MRGGKTGFSDEKTCEHGLTVVDETEEGMGISAQVFSEGSFTFWGVCNQKDPWQLFRLTCFDFVI